MKFRNIKISLKFTALVLGLTLLTVAVVSSIDPQNESDSIYTYLGLALCAFAVMVSLITTGHLTRPLDTLHHSLRLVSKGELPEKTEERYNDEFGKIQQRVDELVEMLKHNVQFAQKVGEGKFDAKFNPAGENDTLGHALINMRDNLVENDRREKERNWIVLGLAEAGDILRTHDTLEKLGDDIIRLTIGKVGAIQGAFYVMRDSKIKLTHSYAYGRKKYLKKSFAVAEGLVGQAVAEKDIVLRTEIPNDYMSITSGILGDQKPGCILIMPLIANEEVHGVLELAGFTRFDSSQINFIKELSVMLARTIFNITVNERTRTLLTESQKMSNDLKEQQEVLRQNAEEMQATQEELQRSNEKLEEQIEQVNQTQNRMQLLLENASEVITIFEANGTIRYISPSVKTILGYAPAELQGTTDLEHVHPEGQELYQNLFKQLKDKPEEKVTAQFEYKTKSGEYIWLEATGNNFMSNRAINGYILNSRDITERRRAEQEQRMRSKMQALSENSPDLITRLENGVISYINPVIKNYTGKDVSDFMHKEATEAELHNSVLDKWLSIIEDVKTSNNTISTEMDFPSALGNRIMQVNAIPEFDEHKTIESVLVVSHDVTDRKLIELDVQHKNKKINDSINYAKRIQNAILPDTRIIAGALPDSFILYKPRDVVSGDFPWFVQQGDDIFIAAVDCTGHGVPGALLSLIGYFLLNDIVKSRNVTDPGKILDLLDEGVTETLRQDQNDAATKDGMDIALCRINIKTKAVAYAGAHRPLLIMKAGVQHEVKGDKFPVGGGVYKNQTNFTTTHVTLGDGDGIYFSSDGFPDQFGGPDGRKLGSKRVRELVEELHPMPAIEAEKEFDHAWESWRGTQKQTDDVLLIGIKF